MLITSTVNTITAFRPRLVGCSGSKTLLTHYQMNCFSVEVTLAYA